jgi:hypothetical protein
MILYNPIHSSYVRKTGGYKALVRAHYQIKAVGIGDSYGDLAPLADEIENLFGAGVIENDELVIGVSTVRPIQFPWMDDGIRYNNLGSEVQIFVVPQ